MLTMCVHTVQKNITINHPEKLNWFENRVQDLLCVNDYIDVDHQVQADTNDLNIIHLNIRGINSKVTELKYLIEHSLYGPPLDIIALCKTWLTKDLPTPNIPGYDFIQKCRENKRGHGVALLISNHIRYKTLPDIQYEDASIESCFVEIKLNTRHIIISSCYRPPNTDPRQFVKMHKTLLSTLLKRNRLVIIGMDHNLDLLKSDHHSNTQNFIETNLNSNLYPTII